MADVALDFRERDREFLAREADGITLGSGACGASDPMHVVGRILGQVEVEYMADIRDVQPS